MKHRVMWSLIHFILMLFCANVTAQEEGTILSLQQETMIETLANETDDVVDDDSYLLQLGDFRRHPLSVNTADENELRELRILTDIQIHRLISYRLLFGKLLSIYELQAVPGWDLETIRKLRPFITIHEAENVIKNIRSRMSGGESNIMFRTSFVPQEAEGFVKDDSGSSRYLGSRSRIFLRYQYNYKNLLQVGLLGDKDAGEQFFKGKQKAGFDFYSYHLFIRKLGLVQALALGDYTVSMGQGLIHWQSSGLRKNADAMMIKRQGPVLKPYRSAGEYNFHRGVAVTVQRKRIELTAFASFRKFSASLDIDNDGRYVSSILTSGYHRTELELEKRKNLSAIIGGSVLKYKFGQGSVALNTVQYNFGLPLKPQDKPYDLFGIKGDYWSNYSIDYSYNFSNIHAYGELAVDRNGNPAFIQGMLLSLDRALDFSLVYRKLSMKYQSVAGNSFTENSSPANETGLYAGIAFRPSTGWLLNVYGDFFETPWLRFKTDAPARGRSYLLQLIHTPKRNTEIYWRFSNEQKNVNVSGSLLSLPEIQYISKKELRVQFSTQFTKALLFRSRIGVSWYGVVAAPLPQKGFLGFTDLVWKPSSGVISGSARLQYFDTDDYNTRIYAYENGPLYDMSIPAFYDQGWRYYVNVQLKPPVKYLQFRDLVIWLRYGEVLNSNKGFSGSGLDKINRSSKSDFKFQLMYSW